MKRISLLCYLLVAGMATGLGASARDDSSEEGEHGKWFYGGEIFGGIGWGGFWHGDSTFGSGIEVGGGSVYDLSPVSCMDWVLRYRSSSFGTMSSTVQPILPTVQDPPP